jgi:hypothetical protein
VSSAPPALGRRRLRTPVIVALGVVTALAVGTAVLLSTPIVANLRTEVMPADTRVSVGDQHDGWSVDVPAGWTVERPLLQDDRVVLATPDGAAEISLVMRDLSLQDAFAAARENLDGEPADQSETLASGLSIVHAESGSQLIAAIGEPGGGRSVEVSTRQISGDAADYRAAFATLLNSIEVAS